MQHALTRLHAGLCARELGECLALHGFIEAVLGRMRLTPPESRKVAVRRVGAWMQQVGLELDAGFLRNAERIFTLFSGGLKGDDAVAMVTEERVEAELRWWGQQTQREARRL